MPMAARPAQSDIAKSGTVEPEQASFFDLPTPSKSSAVAPSILSTSPMKGSSGGAGERVPAIAATAAAAAAPAPVPAAASGKLASIFSTSPVPRGPACFLQAAAGAAEIFGTSPARRGGGSGSAATASQAGSASLPGSATLLLPGDGCATTPARFAQSHGKFFMDPVDLPSGTHTPRSDDGHEVYRRRGGEDAGPSKDGCEEAHGEEEKGDKDYHVKNTFIEQPLKRSPSLEEFIGIRRVNSSPPAIFEAMLNDAENPFGLQDSATDSQVSDSDPESEVDDVIVETSKKLVGEELLGTLTDTDAGSASDLGGSTRAGTLYQAGSGQISDAMYRPELGSAASAGVVAADGAAAQEAESFVAISAEVPSRGSALHKFGACKPCAFVGHGVCRNGAECEFCHLCEPGEKKRRRKEWLENKRQARREAEVMSASMHHGGAMFLPGFASFMPGQAHSARQEHRMQRQMYQEHSHQQQLLLSQAITYIPAVSHHGHHGHGGHGGTGAR